ncbi:MAG: SDR family NAD(P)-dependent oxidoreductase [Acidobacteriales bacterium]|nr:SDR family NAD(P)-dependent oxidoreductase [Terriglobales bacterium]
MQGKVVLVTGAKGGLGNFVTQAFLAAGASVAGVAPSIKQSDFPHPNFAAVPAQISDAQSAATIANQVLQRFKHIDVLVHLVGGFAGGTPTHDTDAATLEKMLDMNFRSAFYMLKAVVPHMRKAGCGRIVAIGSKAAVEPAAGVGAYSASKAALITLIRTVALENKDAGITANVLLPSTIDTPANRAAMPKADTSKWVNPEKLASLIVWLAGDAASEVSGAVIPVYGRDI